MCIDHLLSVLIILCTSSGCGDLIGFVDSSSRIYEYAATCGLANWISSYLQGHQFSPSVINVIGTV